MHCGYHGLSLLVLLLLLLLLLLLVMGVVCIGNNVECMVTVLIVVIS